MEAGIFRQRQRKGLSLSRPIIPPQGSVNNGQGLDVGRTETVDDREKLHHDTIGGSPKQLPLTPFAMNKTRKVLHPAFHSTLRSRIDSQPVTGIIGFPQQVSQRD